MQGGGREGGVDGGRVVAERQGGCRADTPTFLPPILLFPSSHSAFFILHFIFITHLYIYFN